MVKFTGVHSMTRTKLILLFSNTIKTFLLIHAHTILSLFPILLRPWVKQGLSSISTCMVGVTHLTT